MANEEWRRELLRGAVTLADSTIRSLILVNGAAAAGLLTFYGNNLGRLTALEHQDALRFALMSFGLGVFAAIVCSILSYTAQRIATLSLGERVEGLFTLLSFLAALASAGAFVIGLFSAGEGL